VRWRVVGASAVNLIRKLFLLLFPPPFFLSFFLAASVLGTLNRGHVKTCGQKRMCLSLLATNARALISVHQHSSICCPSLLATNARALISVHQHSSNVARCRLACACDHVPYAATIMALRLWPATTRCLPAAMQQIGLRRPHGRLSRCSVRVVKAGGELHTNVQTWAP